MPSQGSAVMSSQGAARCAIDWRVLAVMFGFVKEGRLWRGSQGKVRIGAFRYVLKGHVPAVLLRLGIVCSVEASCGSYGASGLGIAVMLWLSWSSLDLEWSVMAVRERHGLLWLGSLCQDGVGQSWR